MYGLATQLFLEREENLPKSSAHFLPIDEIFAERIGGSTCSLEVKTFLACLMAATRQGHLCLTVTREGIQPSLQTILPENSPWQEIETLAIQGSCQLPSLAAIVKRGNHFYLRENHMFVERFLKHVERLLQMPSKTISFSPSRALNEEQQEALGKALTYPVSLITGGPGTGKTFTAAHIVEAFPKDARIVLTAPTGKAAQQLSSRFHERELIGKTLHALLQIRSSSDLSSPEGGYLAADLIIVDECSMIDVKLFAYLLASVREGAHLVLMGDKDQLPPVESGSLFADLVEMGKIPMTHLKQCMRSELRSILDLAAAIRQGDAETVAGCVNPLPEDIWKTVKSEFSFSYETLPEATELFERFSTFRMLSCVREGAFGVNTINQMLLERYLDLLPHNHIFVAPILLTKNCEKLSLSNGEGGILVREVKGSEYVLFANGAKKYPLHVLPSFEYAYCLSVHKSQGSEYERVLLLVPKGSEIFGREVLYTAVTRAKLRIEICGSVEVVWQAALRSSRKLSGLL